MISTDPNTKMKTIESITDFCQTRLMTSDVNNVVTIVIVIYAKPEIKIATLAFNKRNRNCIYLES